MLTTLEIPDHILKHIRRRAVEEGRSLREVVARTLSAELAATTPTRTRRWKVPVASHNMGWNGLSMDELQQAIDAERDKSLLHRAGLDAPDKRHAQR